MSANTRNLGLPIHELETPALCIDLPAYRRNVARMVAFIHKHGLAWRPHMKGQKAVELAREAVNAGAIGVTCATVYEAETMAHGGVRNILIANQPAGERKLARLAGLQAVTPVLTATDSREHAAQLAAAANEAGAAIPVLIEVDVGMGRCGIAPGEPAVRLAEYIDSTTGLTFAGIMGWEGHVLAFEGEEKKKKIEESLALLTATAQAIRDAGFEVGIVSASGSGTFRLSSAVEGITEVQAGGGVFSDLSYEKWGLDHEFALTVLSRVISRPSATRIIVDAGFKSMSVQHGMPKPIGLGPVKKIVLSAEHGNIELEEPDTAHRVGNTVAFIPGYTDSTLCLHDEICVLTDGTLHAVWAIPGRTGRR